LGFHIKNWLSHNGGVDPSAAAVAFVAANVVTIQNMALYIAQETNPAISTSIINQVKLSGLSVLTDYVYPFKTVVGAASTQSLSFRFNRGHGRKLKYIITSVNPTETVNNMYEILIYQL